MAVTSFAALTIGAAGITMRIYEMNKKIGIRQIDELTHMMHCGQEIYTEGRLSFESSDEICSVLLDFQLKIQEYGVDNVQVFIANSLTDAFNLDFLVTQIRIKTGMKAKILNNSKDHYLLLKPERRRFHRHHPRLLPESGNRRQASAGFCLVVQ